MSPLMGIVGVIHTIVPQSVAPLYYTKKTGRQAVPSFGEAQALLGGIRVAQFLQAFPLIRTHGHHGQS